MSWEWKWGILSSKNIIALRHVGSTRGKSLYLFRAFKCFFFFLSATRDFKWLIELNIYDAIIELHSMVEGLHINNNGESKLQCLLPKRILIFSNISNSPNKFCKETN